MTDPLEQDFEILMPADRGAEARRLGVIPEQLYRVGATMTTALEDFYNRRRDREPPSANAIPQAIAADLVLVGVRIGRGEIPEVLEIREAEGDVQRIVIDFAPGADPEAVAMLRAELDPWANGRALPYGARRPRVIRLEGGTE